MFGNVGREGGEEKSAEKGLSNIGGKGEFPERAISGVGESPGGADFSQVTGRIFRKGQNKSSRAGPGTVEEGGMVRGWAGAGTEAGTKAGTGPGPRPGRDQGRDRGRGRAGRGDVRYLRWSSRTTDGMQKATPPSRQIRLPEMMNVVVKPTRSARNPALSNPSAEGSNPKLR